MASAKITTDHGTIRKWVEAKGGCPAQVKRTSGRNGVGLVRIDYPGYSGRETLEAISWDDFFDKFEESKLAFLYQDERDSRFSKLVKRSTAKAKEQGTRKRSARSRAGASQKGNRARASKSKRSQTSRTSTGRRSTRKTTQASLKKSSRQSRGKKTSRSRSSRSRNVRA